MKVNINGVMVIVIKENGKRIKCMDKEYLIGQMEDYSLAALKMIKETDLVY